MTSDSHSSDVCQSTSVHAIADGLLQLMNTAVYDSEAQVFFAAAAGGISGDGVLSWLSAALKPFKRFFGRQHLQSLLVWAGAGGQQHVLSRLLAKMEADQVGPNASITAVPGFSKPLHENTCLYSGRMKHTKLTLSLLLGQY